MSTAIENVRGKVAERKAETTAKYIQLVIDLARGVDRSTDEIEAICARTGRGLEELERDVARMSERIEAAAVMAASPEDDPQFVADAAEFRRVQAELVDLDRRHKEKTEPLRKRLGELGPNLERAKLDHNARRAKAQRVFQRNVPAGFHEKHAELSNAVHAAETELANARAAAKSLQRAAEDADIETLERRLAEHVKMGADQTGSPTRNDYLKIEKQLAQAKHVAEQAELTEKKIPELEARVEELRRDYEAHSATLFDPENFDLA